MEPVRVHEEHRPRVRSGERERCPECECARPVALDRTGKSNRAQVGRAHTRCDAFKSAAQVTVAFAHRRVFAGFSVTGPNATAASAVRSSCPFRPFPRVTSGTEAKSVAGTS